MLEGVLDFACGLLEVADGLFGASLVLSRRFPVTRPVLFLAFPLAIWALCRILLRMLTVPPLSGILSAAVKLPIDASRWVGVVAET